MAGSKCALLSEYDVRITGREPKAGSYFAIANEGCRGNDHLVPKPEARTTFDINLIQWIDGAKLGRIGFGSVHARQ
jgi:hypothetical protein